MARNRHAPDMSSAEVLTSHEEWEQVDTTAVYTITLECHNGKEVSLTRLVTFEHSMTGERVKQLSNRSTSKFIFAGQWPANDIIEVEGTKYKPHNEVGV